MTHLVQQVLVDWSGRWRFPELASALASGETLGPEDVATLIARGLARPRALPQAVGDLIGWGEFELVESVLEDPEIAGFSSEQAAAVRVELEAARARTVRRLDARVIALGARAREVDVEVAPPEELLAAATIRSSEAEVLLDALEARIVSAENSVAGALRADLSARVESLRLDDEDTEQSVWSSAVLRCIEVRQFGAARTLLESGPTGSLEQGPRTIPRRPPLPWRRPLHELLSWFTPQPDGRAPAGFYADWRPPADDQTATALVSVLERMADGHPPDPAEAADLAAAIDAVIAGRATGPYPTRSLDDHHVITVLHSLGDDWLRPLRVFAEQPVPLVVLGGAIPPTDAPKDAVYFVLEPPEAGIEAAPLVTARTLLGLLGDQQHRRLHLVRSIAGQLPWADALGPDVGGRAPEIEDPAVLAGYVDRLLDLLNVDVDAVFSEVLVHLSGVRSDVTVDLLNQVLVTQPTRRTTVGLSDLTIAAAEVTFLERARARLLGGLAGDDAAKAVLGAVLVLSNEDGTPIEGDDLHEALEVLWEAPLTRQQVDAALVRLDDCRLVHTHDGATVVRSEPLARLLRSVLEDIEGFTTRAIAALR